MTEKPSASKNDISVLLISALVVGMGLAFAFLFSGFSPATFVGKLHGFLSHPVCVAIMIIFMLGILIGLGSNVIRSSRVKQESQDRLRKRQEDLINPIRIYDLNEEMAQVASVKLNEIPGRLAQLCRRGDRGVPDLVDALIGNAILSRSSDIHIEPSSQISTVKYRLDGVLNDVGQIPRDIMGRVCSRLRVLANLTIYEKGKPQDGRIEIAWNQNHYDVRISFLPTLHGDKVVIRLFESGEHDFNLVNLGLSQSAF